VRGGGVAKGAGKAAKAAKVGKAGKVRVVEKANSSTAKLATTSVKLELQLASDAQVHEQGRIIFKNLRSGPRLAQQYGGKASDWVKKTSSSFTKNGNKFETHWYENPSTGQRVEAKTKLLKP
jgi:hypothetical protein